MPKARSLRPPSFGGAGQVSGASERLEGALDLRVVGEIGGGPGDRRAAEVTAAIGVDPGEAPGLREHVVERVERGRRTLLQPELRVEDAAIGIVECHDEVLHRVARQPRTGGGVEVDEHPDQRPALPLAAVCAARLQLRCKSRCLQDQAGPRVGQRQAVLFRDLFPKVLDREIGVALAAQPAERRNRLHRDASPPRHLPPLIDEAPVALTLIRPFQPPHVARRDAENVGGRDPRQPTLDRAHDHFLSRHRLVLLPPSSRSHGGYR